MDRVAVRLECLKLCNAHQFKAEDVVAKAKAYEAYIFEGTEQAPRSMGQDGQVQPKGKPGRPKKEVGNPET